MSIIFVTIVDTSAIAPKPRKKMEDHEMEM
jgi:hypothetical protein